MRICLATANTLSYPQGGHLWVFLNWALGLRSGGHEVIWMDRLDPRRTTSSPCDQVCTLRKRLQDFGLSDGVAIVEVKGPGDTAEAPIPGTVPIDSLTDANLILNFRYDLPAWFVERFARSAFVDIDPGILQHNVREGHLSIPHHDVYFTVGEGVTAGARFGDMGVEWRYTAPCVSLDHWPVHPTPTDAAFTTVSHWYTEDWIVESPEVYYRNDKRSGYEPYFDLPHRVHTPLELAIMLNHHPSEQKMLEDHGWRVREAHDVAGPLDDFRDYVGRSAGEFGCARPAYVKWNTGWLSDRTVCYLASGKPAVVQSTGPSTFLPDRSGIFRFTGLDDAVECFRTIETDYPAQCRIARTLAEEFFDAKKLMPRVLERAMN